jgi:uncharacterized protein
MALCFFATDLHGKQSRYDKLFQMILQEKPDMVFLGGDLLPHALYRSISHGSFTMEIIGKNLINLKNILKKDYPKIFSIMGNDDARIFENDFLELDKMGLWHYLHKRKFDYYGHSIFGYAYVPPTPFLLKDWERYDVSRFIDPGCIYPSEGKRTVPVERNITENATIAEDLNILCKDEYLERSIFLFHSPPYSTPLDRAALDGKKFDHVPLDVHVGSIAIRRFIEKRQPLITLHGHIHESTKITGEWLCQIGKSFCFQAAHLGNELSLIIFDSEKPNEAIRVLI